MSETATRVKAILKVRPALQDETTQDRILQVSGAQVTVPNPRVAQQSLAYTYNVACSISSLAFDRFDGCYGDQSSHTELFQKNIGPLLDHVLSGYNATIFAYGHTGAGKTHTMQGSSSDPGMIERSVGRLLEALEDKHVKSQVRWTLYVSYLEIYKEKVYDLLSSSPASADLPLREDLQRNIIVPGLTQKGIQSMQEFKEIFATGNKNRSMAATRLNAQSSRSHSCLLLSLEQRPAFGPGLKSKLHLIDLAGSEDNRRTANTGERLVESGAINSSLFVLAQVVDALNKGAPRIPFRDSKLTRLLQDSLGGRAYALIITNVAPTSNWLQETVASLNFASKSRNIQNIVTLNTIEEAGKKRPRREEEESYEEEYADSVYELSEPPSSVFTSKVSKSFPTPPETAAMLTKDKQTNPFVDTSNRIDSVIEQQVEQKVAAKLREISKGTFLSPLFKVKHGEIDVKKLQKTIKKGSALRENCDPFENIPKVKSKKQQSEDAAALEEMAGIISMFPEVEPDLLCILNTATVKQLKSLKECGQSRAEQFCLARATSPFKTLAEIETRGVLSAKVLLRFVYSNAMNAEGLAALVHTITSN